MRLRGWDHPVPEFVADAIIRGFVRVLYEKKADILEGEARSPSGCVVSYADQAWLRGGQAFGQVGFEGAPRWYGKV